MALCLLKDADTGRLSEHSEEEEGCYLTQLEMNFSFEFAAGDPLESIWRLPPPVCTDSSYVHVTTS